MNRIANVLFSVVGILGCLMLHPLFAQQPGSPWPELTKEARPWARWWWMGSAVDESNLTLQLKQYRDVGIGGLEIASIYGAVGFEDRYIPFLSPEWMGKLRHTVQEGRQLGLGIDLTTGTGWPFGGPQVTVESAASRLVYRTFTLKKGQRLSDTIQPADPKARQATLMELVGYDAKGKAMLLTDRVNAEGILDWKAPNGTWQLYAVFLGKTGQRVKRAAPGGEGFTLDHFSAEALDRYLARFDTAFAGKQPDVRAFYNDSYEVYGADWTARLFEEFGARRGYDLRLYLPALLAETGGDEVARVKSDYRETIAELLLENFTERWTAWAHRNGGLTKNQAHGSPANLLDLYAAVDIPEMETFGSSDFEIPGFKPGIKPLRGDKPDPILMKFPASAANLTGKKLVSSETFTWLGEHFQSTLAHCKPEVEQCFLAGINHVFYHGTTYSPVEAGWPGWLFYASINLVPNNSWWPHVQGLNHYIARVQSMSQASRADNDVLLYWPVYDLWDDPKSRMKTFTVHNVDQWLHQSSFYEIAVELENQGYGVDYVSDGLLAGLTADGGRVLAPSGHRYRALLIPSTRRMPLATLQTILRLAEQGVSVIFQDWPKDVPGLGDYATRQHDFKQALQALQQLDGAAVQATDYVQTLQDLGSYGESLPAEGLRFFRRERDGQKLYYIVNHSDADVDRWIAFQATASAALLMDPQTGGHGISAIRHLGTASELRLQLRAGESVFVQFLEESATPPATEPWKYRGEQRAEMTLDRPWSLSFSGGGPQLPESQTLDQPVYWTSLAGESYATYSGVGVYETTVSLDKQHRGSRYELVFEDLAESAKVIINGDEAGLVWSVPYRLDVSSYLKSGENTIRVEVANLMANRIRHMDQEGKEWRRYHEINFVDINYKPFDAAAWPVLPSGILGPIKIVHFSGD